MFTAYVLVGVLTAAANGAVAMLDFARNKQVLVNMAKVRVPESWLPLLATVKTAGAFGLLAGIAWPPLGIAAAAGFVVFYTGAIVAHLRVGDRFIGPAAAFLLLAVAALVLRLAA